MCFEHDLSVVVGRLYSSRVVNVSHTLQTNKNIQTNSTVADTRTQVAYTQSTIFTCVKCPQRRLWPRQRLKRFPFLPFGFQSQFSWFRFAFSFSFCLKQNSRNDQTKLLCKSSWRHWKRRTNVSTHAKRSIEIIQSFRFLLVIERPTNVIEHLVLDNFSFKKLNRYSQSILWVNVQCSPNLMSEMEKLSHTTTTG